jgi:hypothetical protein
VYRTATTGDQKERVGRELKKLQGYRARILAVNVIDPQTLEASEEDTDELAPFPILGRLEAQASAPAGATAPEEEVPPPPGDLEVSRLELYTLFFEKEFLPFLTEIRLKLDFKFSMERDSFYHRFQDVKRKIADYREEGARLAEESLTKQMETEMRARAFKLIRVLTMEASRFFRAISRFATELAEDAGREGVKCLNGGVLVRFEKIEGKRHLEGQTVREGLVQLAELAEEVVEFLNVPDIESQENERADRH